MKKIIIASIILGSFLTPLSSNAQILTREQNAIIEELKQTLINLLLQQIEMLKEQMAELMAKQNVLETTIDSIVTEEERMAKYKIKLSKIEIERIQLGDQLDKLIEEAKKTGNTNCGNYVCLGTSKSYIETDLMRNIKKQINDLITMRSELRIEYGICWHLTANIYQCSDGVMMT